VPAALLLMDFRGGAADRDLRLAVLADACADADAEVHRVLTGKVFPRQTESTTTAAWADGPA